MSSLMPYRPWSLKGGDIEELRNPERNKEDRSPFVRYARSAALWAGWVREEIATIEPEFQLPSISAHGQTFQYGLAHIETMIPLVSVPPSLKDHQQRLLEATQLYSEPILVFPVGERYAVIGNHELFAAAKAYHSELARPGKVRASDYCLVAICEPTFLLTILVRDLHFAVDKGIEEIQRALREIGFAKKSRTDDPLELAVFVGSEPFIKSLVPNEKLLSHLGVALGVRSMDFGSKEGDLNVKETQTKVSLVSPKLSERVLNVGTEFPYGTYQADIKPSPGANMWSLRDFRVG